MERFIPVEICRKKINTFRGLTFFSVFTETTEIFCTICLIKRCHASSWGRRIFVLTQAHSLSGVLQMVQVQPTPHFRKVFSSPVQFHLSETF